MEHSFAQVIYNPAVRIIRVRELVMRVVIGGMLAATMQGQQAPSAEGASQPKIQVNFLNSCRPAQGDVEEIAFVLAKLKERPSFNQDFEISRGRTTLSEAEARAAGAPAGIGQLSSLWVRIRHEFPEKALLSEAQYSLSMEGDSTSEILALHLRDNHEVMQVLISSSVAGTPAQVVQLDTPPDRVRLERFGKGSIVLARCGAVDQSAYESLFTSAREILERYRAAMAVKTVVPAEMDRLSKVKESKSQSGNHLKR